MAIAAFIVSIISLVISGFSLIFAGITNAREAGEAKFRIEARPSAEYLGRGESAGRRSYRYRVRNVGGGGASDLHAELTNNRSQIVSETPPESPEGLQVAAVFQPNEVFEFEISVNEEFRDSNPLRLGFRWFDHRATGQKQKLSHAKVPAN